MKLYNAITMKLSFSMIETVFDKAKISRFFFINLPRKFIYSILSENVGIYQILTEGKG